MNRVGVVALLFAWAAVVSGGFAVLMRYKSTPGEAHRPPAQWPRESRLQRASGQRATLVLFAHPECPCTRASVTELARLVAGARTGWPPVSSSFVRAAPPTDGTLRSFRSARPRSPEHR